MDAERETLLEGFELRSFPDAERIGIEASQDLEEFVAEQLAEHAEAREQFDRCKFA